MIVDNLLNGPAGVHYSQSAPQTDEETIEGLDKFLFVGVFKRGPFNKPFKVTEKTLANILGKDYKNAYYIALQDAFETGAAEIWVMRVESTEAAYIEPPYSAWTINPGITVQNGTARYTAYKKNIVNQYDSFAEISLSTAVTRSLYDSNMQQWQALIDAANELTGVTDWGVDAANSQLVYKPPFDPTKVTPNSPVCWTWTGGTCESLDSTVKKILSTNMPGWTLLSYSCPTAANITSADVRIDCTATLSYPGWADKVLTPNPLSVTNPNYNPNAVPETYNISFSSLAQKIISNASSSNQGTALLAEAYLENVATSILSADTSKQFIRPEDLTAIFEANKVLKE